MTDSEREFQKQVADQAGPYATLSHADRINAERTLMSVGHRSRSQVREALQKSAADFKAQQAAAPVVAPAVARPEAPLFTVTSSTSFEPRPLTLAPSDRAPIGGDIPPDPFALEIKDEGTALTTVATSIDITGDGATATNVGGAVTIDIPGPNALLEVQLAGSVVESAAAALNIVGGGALLAGGAGTAALTLFGDLIKFYAVEQVDPMGSPHMEVRLLTGYLTSATP